MVFDLVTTLTTLIALITASRDIIIIIMLIWGFNKIIKAIKDLAKNIPSYLDKYSDIKTKELVQLRAMGVRR